MGQPYPLWIEKIIFLTAIFAAVYVGYELRDSLSGFQLWISWLCCLPMIVVLLSEILGRILQNAYTK